MHQERVRATRPTRPRPTARAASAPRGTARARTRAAPRSGRDRRSTAPRCTRAVARAATRDRGGGGGRELVERGDATRDAPATPAGRAGAAHRVQLNVASVTLPTSTLPHVAQPSSSHVSFPTSHGEVGRCSKERATRTGSLAGHVACSSCSCRRTAPSGTPSRIRRSRPRRSRSRPRARRALAATTARPRRGDHTAMKTTSASPPRTRSAAACCSTTASSSRRAASSSRACAWRTCSNSLAVCVWGCRPAGPSLGAAGRRGQTTSSGECRVFTMRRYGSLLDSLVLVSPPRRA